MALAGTGATTIVGLMATEAWDQARQRVLRLFTRGGDESALDGELTASRAALVAAPEEETDDVTASVRLRLRRLIAQNPEAAEELRLLIEEFTPAHDGGGGSTHNTIIGGTHNGPTLMGRDVTYNDR